MYCIGVNVHMFSEMPRLSTFDFVPINNIRTNDGLITDA